jgi:hypothetical protein
MIQYNNNSISMFNPYIHHYHCQTQSPCHDTRTSGPSSVLMASLFHFSTLFVHITINSISKCNFISFILPEMNGIHWRVLVKPRHHDWKDNRQMFNKYSLKMASFPSYLPAQCQILSLFDNIEVLSAIESQCIEYSLHLFCELQC